MKAMVLAAGFGTRLGALTQTTPKCLVKVGGKAMLEHVVDRLKQVGVRELVINLHYLSEQVQRFVEQRSGFGLRVHFSYEPKILGTGGGILHARQYLDGDEPFFVHNADIFSEVDLAGMFAAARAQPDVVATLAVMPRDTSRVLLFDREGELLGWRSGARTELAREGGERIPLGFCGIHVLSPAIFPLLEQHGGGEFSIISTYVHAARLGKRVRAYRVDGQFWVDVGTPTQLEALCAQLAERR